MAIALGVAWSPVAAALPDLGHLVDFIELPGWAVDEPHGPPVRRKVLHNLDKDFSLAKAGVIDATWGARAKAKIAATNSPWLSVHLGFSTEDVRFDAHMLPEGPVLSQDLLFDRFVHNIREVRRHIAQPLLLENLDYCPEGAYEHICDPAFISAVVEATDTELLLDLAHLRVTASWFGRDPMEMLLELPLRRVFELHISSPLPLGTHDPRLDDAHEPLTDDDITFLRAVLDHTRPAALVLEYRRDPQVLRAQLLQLARVLGRAWRGVGC